MTRGLPRLPSGATEAVLVFLIALLVRIVFAWATPPAPVMTDAADYDRLAHAIVQGRGYVSPEGLPTSERPPLYSYVLAGVYAAFGDSGRSAMRALQAVVDAVTCTMVYLLALRNFGVPAARIGAVFAILSVSLLFTTRHLMTETFAAFFMVATVLALDVALTAWRWTAFLVTGVLVGLSTLTKGTTLALPAALMVPILVAARPRWRRAAKAGAILCAGFAVALLPWTVRNYRVHGEFVPVATQMGWVIYSSYLPPEGKIFGVYRTDETVIRAKVLPEPERSRTLLRASLDHVRENPGEMPRLLLLKFLYYISPFDWETFGRDGVVNFTYLLTLPLALYGLWVARAGGWRTVLLALPPAFLLLLSLAIYGSPRIRFQAEPLLIVLAGGGLAVIWSRAGAYRPVVVGVMSVAVATGLAAFSYSTEVKAFSASVLRGAGLW